MALVELRVNGLAIMAAARLTPGPGLTALTGETGSGKSLCITALRLALGARMEGDVARTGDAAAAVAAVFDDVPVGARALLEAHGIPDDELLTLSRELPAGGRGVSRVNGSLVSLATLRAVGDELVEVTAQGETHRILRPGRQRALVDGMGGPPVTAAAAETAATVQAWREAIRSVVAARALSATSAGELEDARHTVATLGALGLTAGEDGELAAGRRRLRAAAGLREAMAGIAAACLDGDPGSGAADLLAAARAAAVAIDGVDPEVDGLLLELDDAVERVRELGRSARGLSARIAVDDGRLGLVEERLDALDRVRRRHGSIGAAIEALAAARDVVDAAGTGGASVAALEGRAEELRLAAGVAAAELSRRRAGAAARLESAVTARLRDLRLPHARFRVLLHRTPDPDGVPVDGEVVALGTDGVDTVEFRFTAAAEGVPIPLGEGVSGGELSRVALALRAVVALVEDCPTLVLDEVDTGLGGETAACVGEVLARIAEARQVLVVTHRPEIAARADAHVVVVRAEDTAGARAEVRRLTADDRPAEIARLMSGRVTAAALTRARELLVEGGRAGLHGAVRTMTPP